MYGNGPGGYAGGPGAWSGSNGDVPDRPVGERREPGLVLVFSILTCGIYYLWWIAKVSEETQRFLNEPDTSPTLEVILHLVTFGIYNVYWDYKMGKKIARIEETLGMPATDNSLLFLLLDIFQLGIFNVLMQQGHLNDAWFRAGQAVRQGNYR